MKNISIMGLSQLFDRLSQFWAEEDFDGVDDILDFIHIAVRVLRNDDPPDYETVFECGLCPSCGATEIKVDRTNKPTREMYCFNCGFSWETITVNCVQADALQMAADCQKKIDMAKKIPHLARRKISQRL